MDPIIQILQEVGNITSIGVAALALVVVLMAINKGILTKEGIKNISKPKDCPPEMEEIKSILSETLSAISGPAGLKNNDLNHLQKAIDRLGDNVGTLSEGMKEFNKQFEAHDRQAWEIKKGVQSVQAKLKIPVSE